MQSFRRAALRSALSASRSASTAARTSPFTARASVQRSAVKCASPQAFRFFSQTMRQSNEEQKYPAEEAAEAAEPVEAAEAREESLGQTGEDIQEASQETPRFGTPPPVRDSFINDPAKTCFIRNIVFELTEEHILKAFEKYGKVTQAHIARDPRGLSKGYGFVSFETEEQMKEAAEGVNGSFWHGRRVTCVPRDASTTRPLRTNRGPTNSPTKQLFIGNIPYETTDVELNRIFRDMTNVKDVRVAVDRTTGWPRGFAHADFETVEDAMEAMNKLQGTMLGDRTLRFDYANGYARQDRRPNQSDNRRQSFDNRQDNDRNDYGNEF
ncbi:hypothetical protein B0J18DRAFT_379155 [Chaetomium sp. MPI-SDFR-AT-0129]|nr:hypothetical protein B0J18DRAFT_379155 [Chaetomium sp. MPI-SDFR-AT-0129]